MFSHQILDLPALCAVVNALSALGCVWMMQAVTPGFGLGSPLKVVKLGHRFVFGVLAIVLAWNAGYTVATDSNPRPVDLAVQIAFLAVIVLSVVRHRMAPRPQRDLPQSSGWFLFHH